MRRVICDARTADVVITVRGKPVASLGHLTEHEVEGALLMQSPTVGRRMKRALEQVRAGRGVPLDVLIEQIAPGGRPKNERIDVSGAVADAGASWRDRRRRSYPPIADGRRRR